MTMFAFDNTYARDLEGLYAEQAPTPVDDARLLVLNESLADELGLDVDALRSSDGVAALAGNAVPDGAQPLAQAYAGHQFGSLTPQLGDGRAILLGEHVTPGGERRDIVLKGAGRTPFSRGGDGRSALGPALREHLMGEAAHALGIPTTRSLAVVGFGDPVYRDVALPGAVLTRVAASHLRIGTFQFFAVRQHWDQVARLVDFALARHDPDLVSAEVPALALLDAVAGRQASLVAHWMHAGMIHGVMNTDNMTISGETIDYGPVAFLETHDPAAVFSSIDHGGRYAYGNQPAIAQWNLARLAESLLPLIDPDQDRSVELAMAIIDGFPDRHDAAWLDGARRKLGLVDDHESDRRLADDFVTLLHTHRVDHTLGWRSLGDDDALRKLVGDTVLLDAWLGRWRDRVGDDAQLPERLAAANPIVVPRNHLVEHALASAVDDDDLALFEHLLAAVREPFTEPADDGLVSPAPDGYTDEFKTFCGT